MDASNNERLGRYVNDAPPRSRACNCYVKAAFVNGEPHVLIFAKRMIKAGSEIRYDYGGKDLPWRKVLFSYLVCLMYDV